MQGRNRTPLAGAPLALAGIALVQAALASVAGAQDWTNYGGGPARNGRSDAVGPLAPDLAWTDTSDYSIISWHPFIEDGRVFTVREAGFPQSGGAANDVLVAYDLATGAQLWRETLPFAGDTSQEWIAWIGGVKDGRVYASRSSNGQPQPLRAYDAATGALLWVSAAATQAWAHDGIAFAPDGDPIVGDFDSVRRIECTDGSTVWTTPRLCPVSGNCGVSATATAVFIDEPAPGATNEIAKLDIATGARLYSTGPFPGFTTQNSPFLSPDGGTVYFSRSQNNVAVDFLFAFQDTGSALVQLWQVPVRWTTSHEGGIGPDGSLYTFTQANELVRLDAATGAITANAGVLSPIGTSNLSPKTVVDAEGNVYVSNGWASTPASDGRVWAFDADLSQNLFTLNLDRQNAGGPALASDGTLVVCDRVGVYAYRRVEAGVGSCFCDAGAAPCGNPDPTAGCANSTGLGAFLSATGSASVALQGSDPLVLRASRARPDKNCVWLQGAGPSGPTPFKDGQLCVGNPTLRLPGFGCHPFPIGTLSPGGTLATDDATYGFDVLGAALCKGDDIAAGAPTTREYQLWFRDGMGPCATGSNLTSSAVVTWTP